MRNVKNYQNDIAIKRMYEKAFDKDASKLLISKLKGGLKNAVYLIEDNGYKCVLKISSNNDTAMIYVDRNIFWWEIEIMKKLKYLNYPSPRILYYDDSLEICDSPYVFMTYIEGENLLEIKNNLKVNELNNIEYQIGKLSYEITNIKMNKFFLPSYPDKKFTSNYDFITFLFNKLLENGKECKSKIVITEYNNIIDILKKYKFELNDNVTIKLSHTDMWDGNILIKNGMISGIVDFSDLYVCDELLTFYFHTIDGNTSKYFLKGYNNKKLNNSEIIRIDIYRMYVILKMIIDCQLKQYGEFEWMIKNLKKIVKKLKN